MEELNGVDVNASSITQVFTVVLDIKEEATKVEDLLTTPNFVKQAGKQMADHKYKSKRKTDVESVEEIESPVVNKRRKVSIEQTGSENLSISKNLKKKSFFRDECLHLVCEWRGCNEASERMEDFMRHVATHVREVEVRQNPAPLLDVFVCLWTACNFECPNSDEMIRHIHFHSFHTKVKCHGLNMLAANGVPPCKLDSSQRNILPDLSQPFLCEWDACEFSNENWQMSQVFYWHVKDHPEELRGGQLKCRWQGCSRVDTAVSKIKEHMRAHSQERQVGCPTCGGMFANRIKFLDHCLRQQVEEKSFECHICNKKFAIERHLRDHTRVHISHYKCPQCDMTCTSPSTLANHVRYRHSNQKPFACEFCDYRGKTAADIKSHVRIHYNEVELSCTEEDCQFTCRSKVTMKQHHNSTHSTNSSQYACHLCEVRFDRGAYLTKHLTKAHSFSWPSGHSRFRYTKDQESGLYRLQTIRFESVDIQQELNAKDYASPLSVDSQASEWDMKSPLSVQSCPELASSTHVFDIQLQPLSVQPSQISGQDLKQEFAIQDDENLLYP